MSLIGPAQTQSLADWVREGTVASALGGSKVVPQSMDVSTAMFGANLVKNGGMESWSGGTAVVPDLWTLAGGGSVAQDLTNLRSGLASVAVTRAVSDTVLQQSITSFPAAYFQGRTYSMGAWVQCATASTARLSIADSVTQTFSEFHPGDGNWHFLVVTRTIDPAATTMRVAVRVDTNNVAANFDSIILIEGSTTVAFSNHPNDEHLNISNFQTNVPANKTDQGVWRAEIGQVTPVSTGAVTVTYKTAFRTVRTIYLGNFNGDDAIVSCLFGASSAAISSYDPVLTTRVNGSVAFMVIGQG